MKPILGAFFLFIEKCINNPLSLLRITLPILFGKQLYENFDYEFYVSFDANSSLSKTWFLDALPNSLFTLDYSQFIMLKYLVLVSTLSAVIGLLGRINLLILSFLGFFIFGLGESYGIFNHHMSLSTQVIMALALVPGSMKISLDYYFLKNFNFKREIPFWNFPENPKWGFNLILTLVALTYFTAGISKLRYGHGLNWLDGNTLGFYLNERTDSHKKGDVQLIIGDSHISEENKWKDQFGFIAHTYGNYQTSLRLISISEYISSNKFLLIALSIGSILFELLAFVVFINSKYRNMYLLSAIIFHLSIGALMGISFRQYRLICFFLIDWNLIINSIIDKEKIFKTLKINNLKIY